MPGGAGGRDEAALDARIGYGLSFAPRALLEPFAETGLAGDDARRLRLGTRLEATRAGGLALELSGERRERTHARPEHGVRLDLRLRF